MSVILPNSINYKEGLPALPEGTQQINVSANPVNGQTFTAGQQIYFALLNRGFLVLYIAYNYNLASLVNARVSSIYHIVWMSKLEAK